MYRIILASLFITFFTFRTGSSQEISWLPLSGPWGGPVYSLSTSPGGDLFATSSTGLYQRTPGALQWVNISLSINPGRVTAFEVNEEGHLFVIARGSSYGFNGTLFQSEDQGQTWTALTAAPFENEEIVGLKAGPGGKLWVTHQ